MAEDEEPRSISEDEETVRRRIDDEEKRKNPQKSPKSCKPIYDKLSTPNRRLILDLYLRHSYHLPREKVERIKEKLKELYAMTPEETERYFQEMQAEAAIKFERKLLKRLLVKEYKKRMRQREISKALRFIEKVLKKSMIYAFYNPIPPLVSVRLRNLSNIILEQLCDLRNVPIPCRDDFDDRQGQFLINVADWMAVVVERVYYGVQLKKNKELEEIEKENDKTGGKEPKQTASTGEEEQAVEEEENVITVHETGSHDDLLLQEE